MKFILTSLFALMTLFAMGSSPSTANSSWVLSNLDKSNLMLGVEHFGGPQSDKSVHAHCSCSADAFMEKTIPADIPSSDLGLVGYGFVPDLFNGIQINPILAPPRLRT